MVKTYDNQKIQPNKVLLEHQKANIIPFSFHTSSHSHINFFITATYILQEKTQNKINSINANYRCQLNPTIQEISQKSCFLTDQKTKGINQRENKDKAKTNLNSSNRLQMVLKLADSETFVKTLNASRASFSLS